MNVMQRAAAIGRLQEMAERLPDGSFDRLAVNAAVGDMMLQIPGAVKFGGGAWRCFQCGAAVRPNANYCSHCGKRLEWPVAGEMLAEYSGVDSCKTIKICFGYPLDEVQRLVEADKAAKLLIHGLRQLKVQTGSLACMGCQHEDNCGIKGCALIRAAVEHLEVFQGFEEWLQQATSDKKQAIGDDPDESEQKAS